MYEAFKLARELGFDNINMDVILGLPEETRDDIARTAKCLKELVPDSITMHSLSFKRAAAFTTSKSLYNGYEYISTDEYQGYSRKCHRRAQHGTLLYVPPAEYDRQS